LLGIDSQKWTFRWAMFGRVERACGSLSTRPNQKNYLHGSSRSRCNIRSKEWI
jgi:hypothetical protein